MDLLNKNVNQAPQEVKGKKIVLLLLILSILMAIMIVIVMVYIVTNKTDTPKLYVDNQLIENSDSIVKSDEEGNKYISLKDLSELLNYEYVNNEYGKYGVDTAKCYIKNKKLITGFESDSNRIYKYEEGTNIDYQSYILDSNIISFENMLYINVNDIQIALNAVCTANQKQDFYIFSNEYLVSMYTEKLKDTGYTLATNQNELKALSYGYVIASRNGMYGVLNENLEEIINTKYLSIVFDEYYMNYIVSNANKQYGILSKNGTIEQTLKYDGLEILNYENKLYKVKNNSKYGIMKQDGTMLTDIIYDEIGYKPTENNKTLYTLIIPKQNGITDEKIVVKKDEKYGLINLNDGKTYLPCDHLVKLYAINELGEVQYKIEAEERTMDLVDYLKLRNI